MTAKDIIADDWNHFHVYNKTFLMAGKTLEWILTKVYKECDDLNDVNESEDSV